MRVKLNANIHDDLNLQDGGYEMLLPHLANTEEMLLSEEIRLKFDGLNLSKQSTVLC